MKKKIVAVVIALIVVVAIIVGSVLSQRPVANDHITLYGNIDVRQVFLAFDNSDRIVEVRVEEGDQLKAGDVLARQDTQTLALQIQQAQAELAAAQQVVLRLQRGTRPEEIDQSKAQVSAALAEMELTDQKLKRLQGLASVTSGRAISRQDLDDAVSNARVARAQLETRRKALQLAQVGPREEDIAEAQAHQQAAQASLALLQHKFTQAELRAPQAAVVRSRLLEVGDMASPQRPVFTLALTDPKWVRVYINETQLGRVAPGMRAIVTTDSHPDQAILGSVGYISSVAEFTPKNVQTEDLRTSLVYEVRVVVEDPQNRLRLGMPATVRIDTEAPTGSAS